MFISVAKLYDRYAFLVGHHTGDPARTYFRSLYDSDLVSGVEPSYRTFLEAHCAASKIVHYCPSAILAKKASILGVDEDALQSPEERTVDHFGEQYQLISRRVREILSEKPKHRSELLDRVLAEIKEVQNSIAGMLDMIETGDKLLELEDIQRDLGKLKTSVKKMRGKHSKTASAQHVSDPLPVILSLSKKAAMALIPSHETVHIRKVEADEESGNFITTLSEEGGDVCSLHFNESLLLTGITPSRSVNKTCPYHSKDFLERYWEPVTSSVGHFLMSGKNILLSTNRLDGTRTRIKATNLDVKREIEINLKIDADTKTWGLRERNLPTVKASASIEGQEVKCVKPELPTYYGRTGTVKNVKEKGGNTYLSVDFRRGLGILILKDSDVELQPV